MEFVADIPRIYTALAEWQACIIYIFLIRRRLKGLWLGIAFLGGLIFQSVFFLSTGMLSIVFWVPCMALAIVLMMLFIYVCCDISIRDTAYYGIRAFVLAEFTASFVWQIYSNSVIIYSSSLQIKIAFVIILYTLLGVIVWILEKRNQPKGLRLGVGDWELWSATLIGVVIFAMSNLSFISGKMMFSSQYPRDIINIRTMVDLGGYFMLYAHYVLCIQTRAWRELEATRNILQNQYVQYQQSRESIDLINRKYHDLKHQISFLRNEPDPEKRDKWLNEMEEEINQYEAQYKTGNQVLDTILMGKSLYCQKHGITLTCVVDGALLKFMETMDICSIFGNALENAIECELKISDKEKRLIHVSVFNSKGFIMIRIENYYEGKLQLENDLPVTTKTTERAYHGYGLKSIKTTVKKYGGICSINAERNWFELKILLPILELKDD